MFHLAWYEQEIALPSMQQWLAGPCPDEGQIDEDAAWATNTAALEALLAAFRDVRAQQLELLPELAAVDWESVRDTLWGPMPLRWVVTKTYQHMAEHINDVLRIALFWDFYAEEQP